MLTLRASVESKKIFSGWKPVLVRSLAMERMSRVIFLEAAICFAGNLSA